MKKCFTVYQGCAGRSLLTERGGTGQGNGENLRAGQKSAWIDWFTGFLMYFWLVGMVTGQQMEAQKLILVASSQFCGRGNTHIQWLLSEANIYQEDLDSFLVIAVVNVNWLNSTLPRHFLRDRVGQPFSPRGRVGRASLLFTALLYLLEYWHELILYWDFLHWIEAHFSFSQYLFHSWHHQLIIIQLKVRIQIHNWMSIQHT